VQLWLLAVDDVMLTLKQNNLILTAGRSVWPILSKPSWTISRTNNYSNNPAVKWHLNMSCINRRI